MVAFVVVGEMVGNAAAGNYLLHQLVAVAHGFLVAGDVEEFVDQR